MTVAAPGSNAKPNRRTMEALARREKLVKAYVKEGMNEQEAKERAQKEMRDNDKGDWRRG